MTITKNSRVIIIVMVLIFSLGVLATPVSAATSKNVSNGKAFTVKTNVIGSKPAILTISSNWDKTNGGDIYSATIVVTDWQKHTTKKYTYRSSKDGASKKISLPNKSWKSYKYTVTVKWEKTPVLNIKQKYRAKITRGKF